MAETWNVKELLQAGWSEADLNWEMTAERTAESAARGDHALAKDEAGEAVRIARATSCATARRTGHGGKSAGGR